MGMVVLMGDELKWLIGALVISVLVITVIIPTTMNLSSSFNAQGSANDIFIGTAATPHTLSYSPVVGVSAFRISTNTTTPTNATVLTYNASLNATEHPALNARFDNGAVTGATYDLTYSAVVGAGANVTVYVGTVNIATISTSTNWSHGGRASSELVPGTVTFVFNGANASSISNVSVRYQYFNDSTAYAINTGVGTVTPTASGGYYMDYTYGTGVTGSTLALVLLLPLLIAVVFFMLFMKSSGMF
jgi:hypothetical protein